MRCVLIALALAACSVAAAQTVKSPTSASAPTSAPVQNLLKGAIDPCDAAAERGRFLDAAGVANEFEAGRTNKGGFTRAFDRWDEIIKFDKNGNGKIDWFEADAYRTDLRKKVLALFGDESGKLVGAQRDAANIALAQGTLLQLAAGSAASRPTGVAVRLDPNAPAATARRAMPFGFDAALYLDRMVTL